MKIGNVVIDGDTVLAPMAGVTDKAFRQVCKEHGAGYVFSEMASAKAICFQDKKTGLILDTREAEHPIALQLFGDCPHTLAKAAYDILKYNPDVIDINMGCPAPKIANSGGGSALMKNPELIGQIVKEVSNAVDIPVSVKIRKGIDEENVNAVLIAKICQENGASSIIVHGRTKKQMYRPPVDLEIIKSVKDAVSIPVIGNGDLFCVSDVVKMKEYTNCDGVAIARGCLGNPWIFSEINHFYKTGLIKARPTLQEKIEVMLYHIRLICEYKNEFIGMKEARKHAAYYLKGFKCAAKYRSQIFSLNEYSDIERLCEQILSEV